MAGARDRPGVNIPLPAMTADQAVMLYEILGEIAVAIWDAYDAEIAACAEHELLTEEIAQLDAELATTEDPDSGDFLPF